MAQKHRLERDALTRQREVEMELLKEEEKPFDRSLASLKKELAGVKVEKESHWWSRGSVDDKIEALEPDVCSALKSMTESTQQNVTQVAQSVESPIFEHLMRLIKQRLWTKAQILNDSKTLVSRSDGSQSRGFHREIAKCDAILSNRLITMNAPISDMAPSASLHSRNQTSGCLVGKSAESGAGSSNFGGC